MRLPKRVLVLSESEPNNGSKNSANKLSSGFGRPDYARWAAAEGQGEIIADPTPAPAPSPTPTGQVFTVELRYLRRGDKGEDVRAMQGALIARGCSCGRWGADGDFGNDTYAAVRAFQNRNKLDMDGELGPSTAAKLYGR